MSIVLTPISPVPTLQISPAELAARIALDTSGDTTNYILTIYVPGPNATFDIAIGADPATALEAIAPLLLEELPGIYAAYQGGLLTIQDPRRLYTPSLSDLSAALLRYRASPPLYVTLGDSWEASLVQYIPPLSVHKIIVRPGLAGPWSTPPEALTLSAPVVETTPSGWDSMRERLLVPFSPFFAPGQRRDMMLDERAHPFARMLAQEERVVGFHGPWPIVELLSLGFAREKPWTVETTQDSQGEVGSAGGVIRNLPTLTVTWFSETLEGTKLVIPAPAVPPETFGWQAVSLTTGLPNNAGWVIVRRDVQPLPVITGSTPQVSTNSGGITRANANLTPRPTLCRVVDYYVYDFTDSVPPND